MYVNIGELRHRITVLRPRDAPDEAGNLVEQSREPYCTCWAKPWKSKRRLMLWTAGSVGS